MAGVTSASMFMHIVKNKTYGNIAYTNMSEQMAKILRMGANDQSVIDRLNWMRDVQGPMLRDAMKIIGEIDLRLMLAQALHMGDECHNRNNAGTTLLIQALTPGIIQAGYSVEQQREVFEFVASSDYFSGPTWMAMCKAAMDAAHGIEYSTVVTTMARNGVEFGLRVSGLPGQWFTGPAQQVIGPMFAGYKPEDSGLDIGDSAITETYGIGGFAMATAPAIVALVGGTVEEAIDFSRQMREITLGENPNVTIPLLGFMGVPSAIDITRVGSSGILPVINTAIAHKDAGVGMIGAGIVHPPSPASRKPLRRLAGANVTASQTLQPQRIRHLPPLTIRLSPFGDKRRRAMRLTPAYEWRENCRPDNPITLCSGHNNMKELVVVAIGGNSIIKDNASQSIEHQAEAVKAVADTVLEMLASDYDIVLTHGNGPQVGLDLRRAEIAHEREGLPLTPLANCVADTQGGIGYLIQQALNNRLARHGEKKPSPW